MTDREKLQQEFYGLVTEGQKLVAELRRTRDGAARNAIVTRLDEVNARKKELIELLKKLP